MLSGRVAPSLVKYAQLRYASYQPVLMQSVTAMKLSTCSTGVQSNRGAATGGGGGVGVVGFARSSNFIISRSYASNQIKLPSKDKVERIFFKITVFIWDFVWKISTAVWRILNEGVVRNPSVQSSWKKFHSKLEEARKN